MNGQKALGPVGSILGAVAGYALAPVTGGGSLALSAAALGAGLGGTAGAALGTALTKAPPTPPVPPPTLMPDQGQIAQASQASLTDQLARRGRASTIMTGPTSGTLSGN